jgi:hypothetical protein
MSTLSTEAILLRALAARVAGTLPDEFAKDIADLVTEVRRLRAAAPDDAPPAEPQVHAVTGSHHQAGTIRPDPIGRRRAVGFQLKEN